ncbi:RNA-directed DNA polymerase, eukaryota [Tanacetum coccineum]
MIRGGTFENNGLPTYKQNNVLACVEIPRSRRGRGYKECVSYIGKGPLAYAFLGGPEVVIPQLLTELWYTCRYDADLNVIRGTVLSGQTGIDIDANRLRRVLQLPESNQYDAPVSRETARSVLPLMGHPQVTGVIRKSVFQTGWGFMVSTVVRSLGYKVGGLDNVNEYEMQLLYNMYYGRNLDYAELIFDALKSQVNKNVRDIFVPFIRFLSMVFEDRLGDRYDDQYESPPTPVLGSRMFTNDIFPEQPVMSAQMRAIAKVDAIGSAGGILTIWDEAMFVNTTAMGGDGFLAVLGSWKGKEGSVDAAWCIFGDFNEVRSALEQKISNFNKRGADKFNYFIGNGNLIDIPLGGKRFTRISDDGLKFSKLDRFLVNHKFCEVWNSLGVVAKERKLSDHCPLSKTVSSRNPDSKFRDKLKNVKEGLRKWSRDKYQNNNSNSEDHKNEATKWEKMAEVGDLDEDEITRWKEARRRWIEKD